MTPQKPTRRRAKSASQGGSTSEFSKEKYVEGANGMVVCWPGELASADLIGIGPGKNPDDAHLVLMMDPLNLMLSPAPQPYGVLTMARFLRELARCATRMADHIDPTRSAPVTDHPSGLAGAP
jgi:hypothetical protein